MEVNTMKWSIFRFMKTITVYTIQGKYGPSVACLPLHEYR